MPNNVTVRIKWAPKLGWAAAALCLLMLVVLSRQASPVLRIPLGDGQTTFTLALADTPAKQQQGLSGRPPLAPNRGMLFSFDRPAVRCFWMKDMRFSLDIIWVDSAKQILTVMPDVSPQTYPQSFCPTVPAQYVIEIPAGQAEAHRISSGQQLRF